MSRARQSLPLMALLALLASALALYVVVIVLIAQSLPEGPGDGSSSNTATRGAPGTPAQRFPAADYRQSRFPKIGGEPLVGVNYTHVSFPSCSYNDTGIIANYDKPGIAAKVHRQLLRMRKAGIASIRTIVWHETNASGEVWGPVSSSGGTIHQPQRSNLIRYLREVRRFGFKRLTLSFAPKHGNDPLLPSYRPGKFAENWRFIRSVRNLLKRNGPRETRIDLLNEGAPSEFPSQWTPRPAQTSSYVSKLYGQYVRRFGNRDVTVSTIAWDKTNRMKTLVKALGSTGLPPPRWYDVHIGYNPVQATYALQNTDAVLSAAGQRAPLVVGEVLYDSPAIAATINRFTASSPRQVEEVSPWYLRSLSGCQVPPPYRPGAYEAVARAGHV